jgi:hypothetical protein
LFELRTLAAAAMTFGFFAASAAIPERPPALANTSSMSPMSSPIQSLYCGDSFDTRPSIVESAPSTSLSTSFPPRETRN